MSSIRLQDTAGLLSFDQHYGENPLVSRESDLYRAEFVPGFVDKWDELLDWDARARSEGQFFIDVAEKSLSPNGQRTWPPTPDESLRNGR